MLITQLCVKKYEVLLKRYRDTVKNVVHNADIPTSFYFIKHYAIKEILLKNLI